MLIEGSVEIHPDDDHAWICTACIGIYGPLQMRKLHWNSHHEVPYTPPMSNTQRLEHESLRTGTGEH